MPHTTKRHAGGRWQRVNDMADKQYYICDGCAVLGVHEHRCHGGGCQCDRMTCLHMRGDITLEVPLINEQVTKDLGAGKQHD